jgi:hypothetical protein
VLGFLFDAVFWWKSRTSPSMAKSKKPDYSGALTPAIEALVNEILTDIEPKRLDWEDIQQLLKCPPVKACVTTITLIGLSYLGEYSHKNQKIQDFINQSFEQMKGSLAIAFSQLFSAVYVGHAVAEWAPRDNGKTWAIDSINTLKPGTFTFLGTRGQIDAVRYHGSKQIDIPYSQILHIIHNHHLAFSDPGGISDLESAQAAVKAWKIILSEMIIAGSRQATPQTVGYYDPDQAGTPQVDENGNPKLDVLGEQVIKTPQREMVEALSDWDNQSVAVTSIKNRIEAIAATANASFFTETLRILHKLIFLSFLMPESAIEIVGSGTGDSNLNAGQMALLNRAVQELVNQIKEVLLEKMIRPLIEWNFGTSQDSWGEFVLSEQEEESRIELFNALVSALSQQIFSIDDLNVINKLYELARLPKVDKLPTTNAGAPEDLPDESLEEFGLGLNNTDMAYWRMFGSNGHDKSTVPATV